MIAMPRFAKSHGSASAAKTASSVAPVAPVAPAATGAAGSKAPDAADIIASHAAPGNQQMTVLLAEIYRTGTLSAKSLATVTAAPHTFTQDELRRLINAISVSGARYAEQVRNTGSLAEMTGGAIVHAPAWL